MIVNMINNMKYLKLFENSKDYYSIVFLPSGEILELTVDMIWGNNYNNNDDYDIEWNRKLDMYCSTDKQKEKILKNINDS